MTCIRDQALAAYANTVDCTTHPPCAHHRMEHMDRFNATLLLINLNARLAAGETKTQCPTCGYWLWANEIGTPTRGHDAMLIYVQDEPIDVLVFYQRHGWTSLPPTPTMSGYQIKSEAPTPWDPNYQLGRIEEDQSVTIIGDSQAIPLTDGQRFIGIPSGTIGGMHG